MLAMNIWPEAFPPSNRAVLLEEGRSCYVLTECPDGGPFSGIMEAQIDRITRDDGVIVTEIVITDQRSPDRGLKISIMQDC
jgi:hypothetical protein